MKCQISYGEGPELMHRTLAAPATLARGLEHENDKNFRGKKKSWTLLNLVLTEKTAPVNYRCVCNPY